MAGGGEVILLPRGAKTLGKDVREETRRSRVLYDSP